jgi:hypothetical protein
MQAASRPDLVSFFFLELGRSFRFLALESATTRSDVGFLSGFVLLYLLSLPELDSLPVLSALCLPLLALMQRSTRCHDFLSG